MCYSPSIVQERRPGTYFVLNDFGDGLGRAWTEADERRTDRETVIRDLLAGQYSSPVRVIAFDIAEGWSRDVSDEVASEVADRIASDGRYIPVWLRGFIERRAGAD